MLKIISPSESNLLPCGNCLFCYCEMTSVVIFTGEKYCLTYYSLQDRCYFFAFFKRAQVRAKRARSVRHARRGRHVVLRSPEKREKIAPVLQVSNLESKKFKLLSLWA